MSNVVVYTHTLAWKDGFSVNLNQVNTAIKAMNISGFCGLSADSNLRAHFTQIPTDEQITELKNYWNNITADSVESASYISNADKATALTAFKQKLLTKEFQHFTLTDRKILLGSELDDTDWAVING